jgi:hypothetical protein
MNPTFNPVQMFESLPTVDLDALVAAQQRNHDAAVEACRLATEGAKAVAKRQEEILEANVAELQGRIGKLESPEKYLELATAMAQRSFDQAREISDLAAKANREVLDVVTRRSNDALAELGAVVKAAKA